MSKEDESESTSAGHFPPNSKVTGVRCSTAAVITIFPTRALPKILIYKFKNIITSMANDLWRMRKNIKPRK
jgi:hypothetical protein